MSSKYSFLGLVCLEMESDGGFTGSAGLGGDGTMTSSNIGGEANISGSFGGCSPSGLDGQIGDGEFDDGSRLLVSDAKLRLCHKKVGWL